MDDELKPPTSFGELASWLEHRACDSGATPAFCEMAAAFIRAAPSTTPPDERRAALMQMHEIDQEIMENMSPSERDEYMFGPPAPAEGLVTQADRKAARKLERSLATSPADFYVKASQAFAQYRLASEARLSALCQELAGALELARRGLRGGADKRLKCDARRAVQTVLATYRAASGSGLDGGS